MAGLLILEWLAVARAVIRFEEVMADLANRRSTMGAEVAFKAFPWMLEPVPVAGSPR